MWPATESEAKVVFKGPPMVIDDYLFITVFVTGALVEDNTASECIRTVAATYGCKISQLYEYEANEYGYKTKRE